MGAGWGLGFAEVLYTRMNIRIYIHIAFMYVPYIHTQVHTYTVPKALCEASTIHSGNMNIAWVTLKRASKGTAALLASGGISSPVMGGSTGPLSSLSSSLDSGMMLDTWAGAFQGIHMVEHDRVIGKGVSLVQACFKMFG